MAGELDINEIIRQLVASGMIQQPGVGGGSMPMLPQVAGPGFDRYGNPEDFTTAEQGKQGNVVQDWMQMMFSPEFGALAGASGIDGGIDYMQLAEGGDAGPGFVPMTTPMYDSYANSGDPFERKIAEMIADPSTTNAAVNAAIRATIEDEDTAKDYMAAVPELFKERSTASRANAEGELKASTEKAKLSPVAQTYRDAGLPSPDEMYTAESFRPGIGERFAQTSTANTEADATLAAIRRKIAASRSDQIMGLPAGLGGPRPQAAPPREAAPGADYDQQSSVVQAWWNAQKGANTVMDGLGDAVGFLTKPHLGNAIEGAFRAPTQGGPAGNQLPPTRIRTGTRQGSPRPNPQQRDALIAAMNGSTRAKKDQRQAAIDNAYANRMLEHRQQSGRTPTSDSLAARQMLMRQLGMG